MARATGFSLLELIIVIALASILAGTAIVSHQAMRPRLDLHMATRQVVMDLKVARMRAVSRNKNHRIVFKEGSGRYQRQLKSGNAYVDDGPPIRLPQGIVVKDCSAKDEAVTFRPRGNASSFGTVTVKNSNGESRQVIVDIAGQVRVQ